jgi:hypothetical protein
MNKKPLIISAILVVLLICGYAVFDRIFPKAPAMTVPEKESVLSISIVRNDGSFAAVAGTDYERVLHSLTKARPTREMSISDSPAAKVYYAVKVQSSDREYSYFIYMNNCNVYIEIPYEGIYRTDGTLFDAAESYFKD